MSKQVGKYKIDSEILNGSKTEKVKLCNFCYLFEKIDKD